MKINWTNLALSFAIIFAAATIIPAIPASVLAPTAVFFIGLGTGLYLPFLEPRDSGEK